MPAPDHPAPPPRWLRTLTWLAGLLIGASAHVVWWSGVLEAPDDAVGSPVHTHPCPGAEPPCLRSEPPCLAAGPPDARAVTSPGPELSATGVRGAVVCHGHACTIRRDFIERLLEDPSLLSQKPWPLRRDDGDVPHRRVEGVYPGSVAALLGLRNGDAILAIDGLPLEDADLVALDAPSSDADGITITVRRADGLHTLRYAIIDG